MKHLTEFIIQGSKASFTAGGQKWLMRQPTPEESASGDSAWRITYSKVMSDRRLRELGDKTELQQEARIRAAAAESIYMIPLLLETPEGLPAFDVYDEESMVEFERLGSEAISQMTHIYFSVIREAIQEAKKKSTQPLLPASGSANPSKNGLSLAASSERRGRK